MYAREEICLASECLSFPTVQTDLPLRDTGQPLGQMAGTSFSAAEEGHVVPFTGGIMRCTGHCVSLSRVTATFSVSLSESYFTFHRCTAGKSALLRALFSLFVSSNTLTQN